MSLLADPQPSVPGGRVVELSPAAPRGATLVQVAVTAIATELAVGGPFGSVADSRFSVPGVRVDAGLVDLAALAAVTGGQGPVTGALVVRGLVVGDTTLADRSAAELLGPGDVLPGGLDHETLVPVRCQHIVAQPATLVLLDDRFRALVRGSAAIAAGLTHAYGRQVRRCAVHQAICQLSRVEERLLAMMWHLADRWGRVTPGGIALDLDLTHTMLGRLVGARRPTVSLALKQLECDGAVTRGSGRTWLLRRGSWHALGTVGAVDSL